VSEATFGVAGALAPVCQPPPSLAFSLSAQRQVVAEAKQKAIAFLLVPRRFSFR